MSEPEIILTEDGSHTLWEQGVKEHYHSVHGAIRESRHVFINEGFAYARAEGNILRILEIGMGTGLNVLLSLIANRERKLNVHYVGLEPEPLAESVLSKLNYPGLVGSCGERLLFTALHRAPWEQPVFLDDTFILLKRKLALQDADFAPGLFHLVYFDAFSPDVQPEMWTEEVFRRLNLCLAPGGVLITYSAKGEVRRRLTRAGFAVETLPGPPGKREITRAVKP